MNEAKLTARKLQMSRLGFLPVGLSRKELQIEWTKLVKEGKVPKLLRGSVPGEYERYLVSRRGRRDRPGRKKGLKKRKLLEEVQFKSYPQVPKPFKMSIPKMSKK